MVTTCKACKKKTPTGFSCPGCQRAYYCTAECRSADWEKEHKQECNAAVTFKRIVGPWFYGTTALTQDVWKSENAIHAHGDAVEFIAASGLLFKGCHLTEDLLREVFLRCTGDWDEIAFDLRGSKDVPVNPAFDGTAYRVGGILVPYRDCTPGHTRYIEAEEARIPYMFAVEELKMIVLPLSSNLDPDVVTRAHHFISRAGHMVLSEDDVVEIGDHLNDPVTIDAVLQSAANVKRQAKSPELRKYFHVVPHHDEIIARIPMMIKIINALLDKVDSAPCTSAQLAEWQSQVHKIVVSNRPFSFANGKIARILVNILGWRSKRENGLIILNKRKFCSLYYQAVSFDAEGHGGTSSLSAFFKYLLDQRKHK